MSIFDKPVVEEKPFKPFTIVLDKYNAPVIVNSVEIDADDDCVLIVDFDHDIESPETEIADELGRVLLQRLQESSLKYNIDELTIE